MSIQINFSSISTDKKFESWSSNMFRILIGLDVDTFKHIFSRNKTSDSKIVIPRNEEAHFNLNSSDEIENKINKIFEEGLIIKDSKNRLVFNFDAILISGLLMSGFLEYVNPKRDKLGRLKEPTGISKMEIYKKPIINYWIKSIRDYCHQEEIVVFPIWPNGKKFAICLTHDVDNPYYSISKRISNFFKGVSSNNTELRFLFRKILSTLDVKISDGFSAREGFISLINHERKLGVKSNILVSGLTKESNYRSIYDQIYNIDESVMQKSINHAIKNNFSIGLHSSMRVSSHKSRYIQQKELIQNYTKSDVVTNRNHYWNISRKDTCDALEAMAEAGIKYDSSLSYYSASNYRRSIAFPFWPYNFRNQKVIDIVELPPTFMDVWSSKTNPRDSLEKHLSESERTNSLAVIDWHANMFNNKRYGKLADSYIYNISRMALRNDVWIAPMEDIGKWWEYRSKKLGYSLNK